MAQNKFHRTENLCEAVKNNRTGEVASLLRSGLNLNIKDTNGRTALMYAASEGHFNCLKLLLNHDANVDDSNATGKIFDICSRGRICRLP
jgi:ankyrin repeat protein